MPRRLTAWTLFIAAALWQKGGRHLVVFALLSLGLFGVEYSARPAPPLDLHALHQAIDLSVRQHLPTSGGTGLETAIDQSLRLHALPPATAVAAFTAWLKRWDRARFQTLGRVGYTLALAVGILAFTGLLATAAVEQRLPRPVTAVVLGLGLVPAYALVFALGDALKGLRLGDLPLQWAAIGALAVADGLLPAARLALHQTRARLQRRDFVTAAAARLSPKRLSALMRRAALIELLPLVSGRLAAVVGTLVVVGIVPGLYRGSLGGLLQLHDPAVWLRQSLDALWLLAAGLLLASWLADLLYAALQRDRKGIDRLEQVMHRPSPLRPPPQAALLSAAGLLLCLGLTAAIHWRAGLYEVLASTGLTLATAVAATAGGLGLAVLLGLLVPLVWPGFGQGILHLLEAVPRVLGVAFMMTAFNLALPQTPDVARWAVWAGLLGLFAAAEPARALWAQTRFLKQVDFVAGLRSLGLGPVAVFRLHLWPQMKYHGYHLIYPLAQTVVYCEGAIAILRFAMRGMVLRLYPAGSLLAEGTERFTFGQWQGLLFTLACIGLLVACADGAARLVQWLWYALFLRQRP